MRWRRSILSLFILSIWLFWLFYIVLDTWPGNHWLESSENRLSALGSFGDAFGVIASLMTTVAAVAVYATLETEIDARRLRDFEVRFYALLSNLVAITAEAKVIYSRKDKESSFKASYEKLSRIGTRRVVREYNGLYAMSVVLLLIRDQVTLEGYVDSKSVYRSYNTVFDRHVGNLGHYFRTLYHLIKLIDDSRIRDKAYYARVLRAQLSNIELCLLGYNCIVGEGRFKLKPLVERYAMLHNLHREGLDPYARAELRFIVRYIKWSAFRFEEQVEFTYPTVENYMPASFPP